MSCSTVPSLSLWWAFPFAPTQQVSLYRCSDWTRAPCAVYSAVEEETSTPAKRRLIASPRRRRPSQSPLRRAREGVTRSAPCQMEVWCGQTACVTGTACLCARLMLWQTKGVQCPCNVRGSMEVLLEYRVPISGGGSPSAQVIVNLRMDSLTHQGHTPNQDLEFCGIESIFPPAALAFCEAVRPAKTPVWSASRRMLELPLFRRVIRASALRVPSCSTWRMGTS